jgi:hypothetical protein
MVPALVPLVLFANGIAAGIMLGNAMGPAALALRLSYARYVDLIKFMWHRYDPFVPAMNALAFAVDAVLAAIVHGTGAAALFAVSGALTAGVMAISLTRNVPINRYVTGLDPASPPGDWPERDPRARWAKWNHARVALSMAALIANLAGAGVLL